MGKLRSASAGLRLDLDNFDSAAAERSRYVLTSARSLRSCARLGIRPVQLLIKSLNELIAEQNDLPFEAVRVMHESYEKERRRLLRMCQEERERIIRAAGVRWPGGGGHSQVSGLEVVPETQDHPKDRQTTDLYAELCIKGKSVSRSSCSVAATRHPEGSTVCSFSLGDVRYSPATEVKVERLTKDIKKEMRVTVSERDRKIAALMLVKRQQEQASLQLCKQEEVERQEARRQEEAQRAQAEKERRKKLRKSMQRWHEELGARRKLMERREKEKAGQFEQVLLMQEERWRRLKEEVEARRKEKMKAAQKEAGGRKRCQEKLLREKEESEKRRRERERQAAVEREHKARRSRVLQEKEKRRRLEEGNRREMLRHILLKQRVGQQVEQEEAQMRSALEEKLRHSHKIRARAVEARQRALEEQAAQEEEQIQRARLRAELSHVQERAYKRVLVQLSQRRAERAAVHASDRYGARAQQARERNNHRELRHKVLRERVQREEEETRKVRESCISVKECRRERLQRLREQIQEEAHRLARASLRMRERVRQQTCGRTFDQMVLEAQLAASMSRMELGQQ